MRLSAFLCIRLASWGATAAAALMALIAAVAVAGPVQATGAKLADTAGTSQDTRLQTGADLLAESGFAVLRGKRVGLVTNHTGLAGGRHIADLIAAAPGVKLAAILAPEHGFRGTVEAGAKVGNDVDASTGAPVFSLYGKTRKPTRAMLRGIDVLVFDIQDVGVRFYTYISTMGLAMQAAAEARIPFIVLDRPNPLGGTYVSGFVLEPRFASFVGQYPIPIVHGLTVGELARMVKGEHMLPGLEKLDLDVVPMRGWRRDMRWNDIARDWVPTSPNIPSFESALAYPGIGLVGETAVNEGRGTPIPFQEFGAPWLDASKIAARLNRLALPGVRFEPTTYTPRAIANVAPDPRFEDEKIEGVRLRITDVASFQPLETGIHVLVSLVAAARAAGEPDIFIKQPMLRAIAGTERLHRMLAAGAGGDAIIASWPAEVAAFGRKREPYLLY